MRRRNRDQPTAFADRAAVKTRKVQVVLFAVIGITAGVLISFGPVVLILLNQRRFKALDAKMAARRRVSSIAMRDDRTEAERRRRKQASSRLG